MNARQDLVEDWNKKLVAASSSPKFDQGQFGWVRQVYARIYRFLTSRYGDADWRSDVTDADQAPHTSTIDSAPPSLDRRNEFEGLQPKQPNRIRETLKSIHDNSSGIATAGQTTSTDENMWVVVGSYKKSSHARSIRERLKYCGIEACLQHRAGDTAALVRRDDFHDATAIVERPVSEGRSRFVISRTYSPVRATGAFLLASTSLTMIFVLVVVHENGGARPWTLLALWCTGLAAAWLCFRRRNEL